jgi:hypothetical protein
MKEDYEFQYDNNNNHNIIDQDNNNYNYNENIYYQNQNTNNLQNVYNNQNIFEEEENLDKNDNENEYENENEEIEEKKAAEAENKTKDLLVRVDLEKDLIKKRPIYIEKPSTQGNHVTYIIKGTMIDGEVIRRYKEFDALHNKLTQRWPGIYLPSIPKKQIINNTEVKTIIKRLFTLDCFCHEIIKYPWLMDSNEVKQFFSPTLKDVQNISKLPAFNYEEIKDNYENYIKAYLENKKQIEFTDEQMKYSFQYIDKFAEKIKIYKETINKLADAKEIYLKNSTKVFRAFEEYEKAAVSEYIERDYSKLVFFNSNNSNLSKAIVEYRDNIKNPYHQILNWLNQSTIDLNSMKDCLNNFLKMKKNLSSLQNQVVELQEKISNLERGKKSFFDKLKFKDNDSLKAKYSKDLELKQKDIDNLIIILKILKEYYSVEVYKFFKDLKISMYEMMKKFAQTQLKNSCKNSEIWLKVNV